MKPAGGRRPWPIGGADLPFWAGALGYALLILGRRTLLSTNATAAIWPASGVMAVAFVLSSRRYWKWLILVGVAENVVLNGAFGFAIRTLLSLPEAMLLAWLIRLGCPRSLNFADPRTLLLFIVKALIPTCLISSLVVYLMPNGAEPHTTVQSATRWFFGHALGAAIAVPSMITVLRPRRYRTFKPPGWELGAVCLAVLVYAAMLLHAHAPVLSLLMFPLTMFVAFRYGPVGASTVSLLMMVLALMHIYAGIPGPRPREFAQIQWVQMFAAVVFLTSLPAAGALASLQRTRRLLARRTEVARQARRRADEAALAKSRFLANMSHEIRTPLNGVIGLADALSRTVLLPGQREMVDMIQGSGRALNGLLSDVLDLARADAGGLRLSPEPFDPREAVDSASYLFETIAHNKGLDFTVTFDSALDGRVFGDALRIRQIVSNLISNAVKFTETGSVQVRARLGPLAGDLARAELVVEVIDTGPGFDDQVQARLFRRFEQADDSIAGRFGGTGLGLAISRELTELMGGEIGCRSAPGHGAAFSLRLALPRAPETAEPQAAAPEPSEPAPGRRLQVLLAEDHPVNQRVVQAILGEAVELTIVEDGEAAVNACRERPFDVILMDIQMPVMDGLTAIRAIRSLEARQAGLHTPIISLTADAMPHQVQAAMAAGADRHLAKPVTASTLIAALTSALERQAA